MRGAINDVAWAMVPIPGWPCPGSPVPYHLASAILSRTQQGMTVRVEDGLGGAWWVMGGNESAMDGIAPSISAMGGQGSDDEGTCDPG